MMWRAKIIPQLANAWQRATSDPQHHQSMMPASCDYRHLKQILKNKINTSFLQNNSIIQTKLFIRLKNMKKNFQLNNKLNQNIKPYLGRVNNRQKPMEKYNNVVWWPNTWNTHPVKLDSVKLQNNKLIVIFISLEIQDLGHAGFGILHKNDRNEREYFVIEPHGYLYPYHKSIAKFFNVNADNIFLPFKAVQGHNRICVAHSFALLYYFINQYKQYGNRALVKFRTHQTNFTSPPVLNPIGKLNRQKTGRTTTSANFTFSKKPSSMSSIFSSMRAQIDIKNNINTISGGGSAKNNNINGFRINNKTTKKNSYAHC